MSLGAGSLKKKRSMTKSSNPCPPYWFEEAQKRRAEPILAVNEPSAFLPRIAIGVLVPSSPERIPGLFDNGTRQPSRQSFPIKGIIDGCHPFLMKFPELPGLRAQ